MAPDPAALLHGTELHSPPRVYLRLHAALANPRASVAQIADLLREDTGLTARVLRLVNSPFFGFPSRIESISRAVLLVGTQQILDLVLATTVLSRFPGIPRALLDVEAFWLHGVATGVAARVIAAARREVNVERFFVAGVLHDVGRLLLVQRRPQETATALRHAREGGEPLLRTERAVLGYDHAAAGATLLQAWGLPPSLQEAVAWHHEPTHAPRYPLEAAIVHVADVFAHALELGASGERHVPPLDPAAWDGLGLPVGRVPAMLEQIGHQVDAARHLVGIGTL